MSMVKSPISWSPTSVQTTYLPASSVNSYIWSPITSTTEKTNSQTTFSQSISFISNFPPSAKATTIDLIKSTTAASHVPISSLSPEHVYVVQSISLFTALHTSQNHKQSLPVTGNNTISFITRPFTKASRGYKFTGRKDTSRVLEHYLTTSDYPQPQLEIKTSQVSDDKPSDQSVLPDGKTLWGNIAADILPEKMATHSESFEFKDTPEKIPRGMTTPILNSGSNGGLPGFNEGETRMDSFGFSARHEDIFSTLESIVDATQDIDMSVRVTRMWKQGSKNFLKVRSASTGGISRIFMAKDTSMIEGEPYRSLKKMTSTIPWNTNFPEDGVVKDSTSFQSIFTTDYSTDSSKGSEFLPINQVRYSEIN